MHYISPFIVLLLLLLFYEINIFVCISHICTGQNICHIHRQPYYRRHRNLHIRHQHTLCLPVQDSKPMTDTTNQLTIARIGAISKMHAITL